MLSRIEPDEAIAMALSVAELKLVGPHSERVKLVRRALEIAGWKIERAHPLPARPACERDEDYERLLTV